MLAFKIGPCRVRINFSFFALIAFCCIFTGAEGGLACFLAVCVHEAAHLTAMVALGAWPEKVEISALGCRIGTSGQSLLSDRQNIMVSLAGPAVNWLCAAAMALYSAENAFFGASLAMALIHSLPIEPLDGGLALHYFFRSRYPQERAELLSRIISTIFLIPLAALGFLVLFNSRYNYSLLALSVYLMLYLVLKWDLTQP